MRLHKWLFVVLITFLTVPVVHADLFSKSKMIVVLVLDQDNQPVEGVTVSFSFRNYPQDDKFQANTDKEGRAQIEKYGDQRVSINVDKEGYYYSQKVVEFDDKEKGENPQYNIYKIILKEKRNPVPMYAKRIHSMKVPVIDTSVGYDLEVGDWVAPYGKGMINDFIFLFHHEQNGRNDFTSSFELTFSKQLDGIQEFQFERTENSIYKWPYNAPTTEYKSYLSKYISKKPNKNVQSNVSDGINYIFRVRTEVDENGNIIAARYGKILGDIQIGIKLIGMTYYFNPDGTANLEFDTEYNLFSFSRDEYMNEVQRP